MKFHGSPYAKEFGSMALLMLRSSGFHGSPYAKEFGSMALLMLRSSGFHYRT